MSTINAKGRGEIKRIIDLAFEGRQKFVRHNTDLAPVVLGYTSKIRALVAGILADQELSITPIGSAVRGTALPGRTDLDFYLFSDQLNGYDNNGLKRVSSNLQECYFNNLGGTVILLRSTDVALAHTVSRLHKDKDNSRYTSVCELSSLEIFLGKSQPESSVLVTAHTQLQAMQKLTSGSTERALILKSIFNSLGIYGTNTNTIGSGLNGVATELLALRADLSEPNQVADFIAELVGLILHMSTDKKSEIIDGRVKLPLADLVPGSLPSMPVGLKQILEDYPIAVDHAAVLSRHLCSS